MCWGSGSPTVVLDAGTADAGISALRFSPVLEGLAAHTRVCAYDRAGLGGSDPPPPGKRYLDDAARDLHQLLGRGGRPRPLPASTVVTAREGQSADPEEQRVWLKGSSKPRQVVLDGGHVIHEDNPSGVLAEILNVLESTR